MTKDKQDEEQNATKKKPAVAAVLIVLLAGGVLGLLKNADHLIRPALRYADDASRSIARNADEAGGTTFRQADESDRIARLDSLSSILKKSGQTAVENPNRLWELRRHAMVPDAENESALLFDGSILVRDSKNSYRMEQDGYYYLSETYAIIETRETMDGTTLPVEHETDTELPNRVQGEYDRRKIKPSEDGRIMLIEEYRYAVEGNTFVELTTESEVEFSNGDWTQFTNGEDVTVRYSESGLKEFASSMATQIEQQFASAIRTMLKAELGTTDPPNVTCKAEFTRISNETMVISKETIQVTSEGPLDVKIKAETIVEP